MKFNTRSKGEQVKVNTTHDTTFDGLGFPAISLDFLMAARQVPLLLFKKF